MSGPRSLMTVPANREDMLAKAPQYGADAIVFDLEDSVPHVEKARARQLASDYVAVHRDATMVYVRVNPTGSGLTHEDLDAVVRQGLVGIRLPKVESADAVVEVDEALSRLESERELPPKSIVIEPGIESARGVWFAYEIAAASPRVKSMRCSTARDGDLQADIGYEWSAEGAEVAYIRSRVLVAARAAGVRHLVDGTFADVNDLDGLRKSAIAARRLGYRGKSVIHPRQVAIVNEVFAPREEDVAYYRRVIEALNTAAGRGSAATTVDGNMVDIAMARAAERMIAWHDEHLRAHPSEPARSPITSKASDSD